MSGMPSISIRFLEQAATAIARGSRGAVGLVLRGAIPTTNPAVILSSTDIVSTWSTANKQYILDALTGYIETPQKVVCYFIAATAPTGSTDEDLYNEALQYFSKNHVDYLAIPTVATDEMETVVKTWVKNEWDNKNYTFVILPNTAADHESVINFTTDSIAVKTNTYTTEQYTPRIAGLLAGTPITISSTYAPLSEVDNVERLTSEERDAAVNAGKFILYHDGEKVKVGRGVTSFVTTTSTKGDSFKKIKLVNTMCFISTDIKKTIEDSYIGKYPNIYDNKVLLICAIRGYLDEMDRQQIIESDFTIDIDTEANANYLRSKGIDISSMTEDEIRKANTGDHVFLVGRMKLVDTMEDVDIPIYI